MSALSDAMAALRNVVLMQERLDVMQREVARLSGDMRGLNDSVVAIDKRLVRIEAVIEMGTRGRVSPQIEG